MLTKEASVTNSIKNGTKNSTVTIMLNKEQSVALSDTTEDDSSNAAGNKKLSILNKQTL